MATKVLGPILREGERSMEDGHRDYNITFLVETTDHLDGPQAITLASGLPTVGSTWTFGNDFDAGAFCTPYVKVQPSGRQASDEPVHYWNASYKFTSRPLKNCESQSYDNPILRPDKVSGSFVERSIKVRKDKDGNAILTTSKEEVEVEESKSYPTVRIEQYDSVLGLSTFAEMVNGVNTNSLWGLAARTIKLANVAWERNQYGSCFNYYTRVLDFEINYNTWDRSDIANKGQKVIKGSWVKSGTSPNEIHTWTPHSGASVTNAHDYIDAHDYKGNSIEVYLDSVTGGMAAAETFLATKQLRVGYDFLTLGIPTSF